MNSNSTHDRGHLLFSASCIDAMCFSAVPGDMDLGSSGSANTSERVVLARASLIYGDRHLGLELCFIVVDTEEDDNRRLGLEEDMQQQRQGCDVRSRATISHLGSTWTTSPFRMLPIDFTFSYRGWGGHETPSNRHADGPLVCRCSIITCYSRDVTIQFVGRSYIICVAIHIMGCRFVRVKAKAHRPSERLLHPTPSSLRKN